MLEVECNFHLSTAEIVHSAATNSKWHIPWSFICVYLIQVMLCLRNTVYVGPTWAFFYKKHLFLTYFINIYISRLAYAILFTLLPNSSSIHNWTIKYSLFEFGNGKHRIFVFCAFDRYFYRNVFNDSAQSFICIFMKPWHINFKVN